MGQIDRVTITGADDNTRAEDLIEISRKYPFVEWAFLVKQSFQLGSKPKFPSTYWLNDTIAAFDKASPAMDVAVHLCGELTEKLLFMGNVSFTGDLIAPLLFCNRIQINFGGKTIACPYQGIIPKILKWANQLHSTIILQDDGHNAYTIKRFMRQGTVDVLYDHSCGEGTPSEVWPARRTLYPSQPNLYLGYAGGIGPDNIEEVVVDVPDNLLDSWIDMQTNVRTGDQLDLDKVVDVLEKVKEVMYQ